MKLEPDPHGAGAAPGAPDRAIGDALMRDALLGAGTSVWEWHVRSDRLSNIDTSAALLGYAPGELESVQAAWNLVIHPDERAANHAAYLRHASGQTPIYEHEYRARCKDGSWRWVAERGRVVERAPDGVPLRMVGTLSDITLRREAQGAAAGGAERASAHEAAVGIEDQTVYGSRWHGDELEVTDPTCRIFPDIQLAPGVAEPVGGMVDSPFHSASMSEPPRWSSDGHPSCSPSAHLDPAGRQSGMIHPRR